MTVFGEMAQKRFFNLASYLFYTRQGIPAPTGETIIIALLVSFATVAHNIYTSKHKAEERKGGLEL